MTIQVNAAVSTGTARQVDRSRLARYATAAAGVAAGAATGVGEAAVVTSTPGVTVWTHTFSGPAVATAVSVRSGFTTFANWGDPLLNAQFKGIMSRGLDSSSRFYRYGAIAATSGGGGKVWRGRLASGAVIGAAGAGGAGSWWVGGGVKSQVARAALASIGFQPFAGAANPWSMAAPVSAVAGTANADSVRGFLAFRIAAGGGDYYYGYFDVEFSRSGNEDGSSFTTTVYSWAYENSLNQSITISSSPAAIPGGAGLAALAFGAAGLRGRRRSRN